MSDAQCLREVLAFSLRDYGSGKRRNQTNAKPRGVPYRVRLALLSCGHIKFLPREYWRRIRPVAHCEDCWRMAFQERMRAKQMEAEQ